MKMLRMFIICASLLFTLGCSQNKKELYNITDSFVESLNTTYQSYGLQGTQYSKTTSDGLYTVTPFGRLVNVKIQKVVEDKEYEKLRKDLEKHYTNDKRVNSVYINNGGTVMIDCRD